MENVSWNKVNRLLGYILYDYNKPDGPDLVEFSIQDFIKNGYENILPFIDERRVTKLVKKGGVEKHKIQSKPQIGTRHLEGFGWSPVARFLTEMQNRGKLNQIGLEKIPDRLLITTNRKVLSKLFELGNDNISCKILSLLAQVKMGELGRNLRLKCHTPEDQLSHSIAQQSRRPLRFGVMLESYLTDGDIVNRLQHKLFSVHAVEIGDIVLVYECEVDAIRANPDDSSQFDLLEIKFFHGMDLLIKVFNDFTDPCASSNRNSSGMDVTDIKHRRLLDGHILQAELGQASKLLYGVEVSNWRQGDLIKGYEHEVVPKRISNLMMVHLNQLFESIKSYGIEEENVHWDGWLPIQAVKEGNHICLKISEDNMKIMGIHGQYVTVTSRRSKRKKRTRSEQAEVTF